MELFDVVELTKPRPESGLDVGSVGTIIHIFDQPRRAYEVEFVDEDGSTVATETLLPDEVRPAKV